MRNWHAKEKRLTNRKEGNKRGEQTDMFLGFGEHGKVAPDIVATGRIYPALTVT